MCASSPISWVSHGHAKELHIDNDIDTIDGEYIGQTTVSPTIISLDQEHVRLTINIRHKHGTTREDIQDAFTAQSEEYGYDFNIVEYLDPMWVSRELPFLHKLKEVAEEYGMDGSFQFAPGTSYAKSMANFVSWGPVLPGEVATAHIEDERLSVETMLLATKLYGRLISRMTIEES